MQFRELATYLEKLEKTSSRNEITEILAGLFKKSEASEIDKTVYLLSGRLAPNYKGINFSIAEKMMLGFWPVHIKRKPEKWHRNLRKREISERLRKSLPKAQEVAE
jgi:hypothetical protein